MTQRKNFIDTETAEEAAYCLYMLAASNDPAERQRLAERLLRDLPIDDNARQLGQEMKTYVMAQRAKKASRRRQMFSVEDIISTDDTGRVTVNHDKLALAHSDTVSQVLATLRNQVAVLMAEWAVQL